MHIWPGETSFLPKLEQMKIRFKVVTNAGVGLKAMNRNRIGQFLFYEKDLLLSRKR